MNRWLLLFFWVAHRLKRCGHPWWLKSLTCSACLTFVAHVWLLLMLSKLPNKILLQVLRGNKGATPNPNTHSTFMWFFWNSNGAKVKSLQYYKSHLCKALLMHRQTWPSNLVSEDCSHFAFNLRRSHLGQLTWPVMVFKSNGLSNR